VKRITYIAVPKPTKTVTLPHGKGAASGLFGAMSNLFSGNSMSMPSLEDHPLSTVFAGATTVGSTVGSGVSATLGSTTGTSSGSSSGTTLSSDTVITGADGQVIDITTLSNGDTLPAGATIRTADGTIISGPSSRNARPSGTATLPAAGAVAAPAASGVPSAARGATTTGSTTTVNTGPGSGVQLVTQPDGTISAIPTPLAGGSQGGVGSRVSFSGGNSTTYTSGIGPFPTSGGTINGFGVTNAGFPIVGNTPVAFMPPERAALYPSSNTTINWPCGDKPVGTEILKGVPCGTDLVAVPTAALPRSEVTRLQGNIGAATPTTGAAMPEAGEVPPAAPVNLKNLLPAQREVPKEAALQQSLDQKLFAYMQKVSYYQGE